MRYDMAIIGAGPAGLSAALNASVRNKNIILFGVDSPSLMIFKDGVLKESLVGFQSKDVLEQAIGKYL